MTNIPCIRVKNFELRVKIFEFLVENFELRISVQVKNSFRRRVVLRLSSSYNTFIIIVHNNLSNAYRIDRYNLRRKGIVQLTGRQIDRLTDRQVNR